MMNRTRKVGVVIGAVMTGLFLSASAALATPGPLDDVSTQVNSSKTEFVDFVIGTGIPVLFSLLILGVGIKLGVKYLRKAARSA